MMKVKKDLGLLEVFCISSGAMISSGLFILPALAFTKAGPAVILAYAMASLLVLPTILSKAELTTAMPKTGGIYFFTDRSMGPLMGMFGGFAAWFSLAFKSAFALLGIGIISEVLGYNLPAIYVKLIAVGFCLLFAFINIKGVKLAGRFQSIIVLVLLGLLVVYVLAGLRLVDVSRYHPFMDKGFNSVLSTVGLIFISFAGTTKIAAVAGEVKNPGRNLPLGMFLSWGIVSLLYIAVISITIGVLEPDTLTGTLTPITEGGFAIMGGIGIFLMTLAALLAFISTGNAGVLAASRDPYAMSKDDLLPKAFSKMNESGSPWFSILITTGFMIVVILFLDLEQLVKTASTMKLVLFALANLALIFMRKSNFKHYRPKYRAPFYPWIQIFAIGVYIFLIIEMGFVPIMIVLAFSLLGLLWYFIYARGKIEREYALLHVIKDFFGIKQKGRMLDEELREIMIDRDDTTVARLERKICEGEVLDINYFLAPDKFTRKISYPIAKRVGMEPDDVYRELFRPEEESYLIIRPSFAVISYHVKRRDTFEIVMVRTKRGAMFSEDSPPVHAAFVIVSSLEEKSFFMNTLMWLVRAGERPGFAEEWKDAKDQDELKEVILRSLIKEHK